MKRLIALLLCFLGAVCLVSADILYGTLAPKDSAFVRLFRLSEGGGPLELGAWSFDPPLGGVTPYRPLPPDIYLLNVGGTETELIPQVRQYYTLVLTARGVHVILDVEHTDPARAQLVLYNLLPRERVALKTADGRTQVIAAVGPGEAGRINVNAVPVQLGVFGAGGRLASLGDPGLQRGASYSVFVYPTGSTPAAVCLKAELAVE